MRVLIAFLVVLFSLSGQAQVAERVIWDKNPISVLLPVGQEKMVTFPMPVELGFAKNALYPSQFQAQNVDGTLYLKALKPFGATRAQVKLSNGKVVLLDLRANRNADNVPVEILFNDVVQGGHSVNGHNANAVTLTRYALQQLYGVERLIEPLRGISRVPLHTTKTVDMFHRLKVMAMPRAQWKMAGLYVAAVELRNLSQNAALLDSKSICGDWVSASFYPNAVLSGRGNLPDTTMLILVSSKPFGQALRSAHYAR